jgi:hypothetical protein
MAGQQANPIIFTKAKGFFLNKNNEMKYVLFKFKMMIKKWFKIKSYLY